MGMLGFICVHYGSMGVLYFNWFIIFHMGALRFTGMWYVSHGSMLFHMGAIYRYIMFQMGTLCFIGFIASHWCTMFHSVL